MPTVSERVATIERKTAETQITLRFNVDGTGFYQVATGLGFLDHMLAQIARHGFFDLEVTASGDLEVDGHHLVEDTGIVLGQAIAAALGERKGIRRFGSAAVPMDEALVLAAVDISGRPGLSYNLTLGCQRLGQMETELVREFFQAIANAAAITLHLHQLAGFNTHHVVESACKSFARALDEATAPERRSAGQVPSTKGLL
ncbi:MAG: imidazoleglycerol-phosphate dehydratase HisB [Armatimonadetes bacterium]|nr:imidazoleglycerol-phosphate dehydratase HisB [Armatimonadota bacterium]